MFGYRSGYYEPNSAYEWFDSTPGVFGTGRSTVGRLTHLLDHFPKHMGTAEDCGDALQVSCLEGFDTLGLHLADEYSGRTLGS